jgi:hypothetical protein
MLARMSCESQTPPSARPWRRSSNAFRTCTASRFRPCRRRPLCISALHGAQSMCSAAAARAFPRRPAIRGLTLRVSILCAATLAPMSQHAVESSSLLDGPTCIWQRPAGVAVNQLTSTAALSTATPAANIHAHACCQWYSVVLTSSLGLLSSVESLAQDSEATASTQKGWAYGSMLELATSRGGRA